ncbi:MAG: putative DNA binding domain-containing protein [Prevotellaceae bacterium]|jgi:predicted HTH transcriptional regulator|nr:putative DNA binding domain-containing protein [Prevotellaceae bacterium]
MYLYNLIAQGEHETLEFKYEINDPRKIARTLVAFANTKGGRLLVGIKDNGNITGISIDEEYYMVESGAKLYSRPEIDFKVKIHPIPNGKHVLEFIIESSGAKPHHVVYTDKPPEVLIRVHDENIIANPVWIKVQERLKSPCTIKYTAGHNRLLAYLKGKKAQSIEILMKEVFLSEKEATEIITDLVVSNIMEIETTNSGAVFKLKQV